MYGYFTYEYICKVTLHMIPILMNMTMVLVLMVRISYGIIKCSYKNSRSGINKVCIWVYKV